MTGGGAGLAGESGGEETVGAGVSRKTATAGPEDGSSAPAPGFPGRESFSVPLRLPNTTVLHAGHLFCPQLLDQRRQERASRLFGLAAACQPLRDLKKHFGGAMTGGNFRDHLAIIGRRSEHLRIEGNGRDRLAFNRLGKFAGVDFGPLWDPDLIAAKQGGPA